MIEDSSWNVGMASNSLKYFQQNRSLFEQTSTEKEEAEGETEIG